MVIVLVGASASGKTELAKILIKSFGYEKVVTTTTRPKRKAEKENVDYHFLDRNAFIKLNSKDAFFEVSIYQGQLYGIQKKDVKLNGIVIVEPDGANTLVTKLKQKVFVVYLETDESLRSARMVKRGTPIDEVEKRLTIDRVIFQPSVFIKMDLHLKNDEIKLESLAKQVHDHYQTYIQKNPHS